MKNKTERAFDIEDHPEIEQFIKEQKCEDVIMGIDDEGEWICASELIYKFHQKQLELTAVVWRSEQLLCSCDNSNGFKEMEEGREICSKCKKPY